MDNAMAERMYQASEESWRSAGATWAKAFDAAQAGSDLHMWAIEEAAWGTYRSAAEARNLAWQLTDQISADAREKARREALERLASGNGSARPPITTPVDQDDDVRSSGLPTFRLETAE